MSPYKKTLLFFVNHFVYQDLQQTKSEDVLVTAILTIENIAQAEFEEANELYFSAPKSNLFAENLSVLKGLKQAEQIRCVAWLFIVSRSDSRTDDKEWQVLYQLYAVELKLNLIEIVRMQLKLSSEIRQVERNRHLQLELVKDEFRSPSSYK